MSASGSRKLPAVETEATVIQRRQRPDKYAARIADLNSKIVNCELIHNLAMNTEPQMRQPVQVYTQQLEVAGEDVQSIADTNPYLNSGSGQLDQRHIDLSPMDGWLSQMSSNPPRENYHEFQQYPHDMQLLSQMPNGQNINQISLASAPITPTPDLPGISTLFQLGQNEYQPDYQGMHQPIGFLEPAPVYNEFTTGYETNYTYAQIS